MLSAGHLHQEMKLDVTTGKKLTRRSLDEGTLAPARNACRWFRLATDLRAEIQAALAHCVYADQSRHPEDEGRPLLS